MSLLAPAALGLLLLAGPILLLYMLKLRRKPVTISSTMLWQRLLRDRQANTPWQRLQRNLLLILQLLILTALVLALARPAQPVPGVTTDTVIILLDASASMNATDVPPSRFDAAIAIAQDYVTNLSPDARMTIIRVGPEPRTLLAGESDRSALGQALERARASQGPADWQAAFILAAGAASSGSASVATVIVSDGSLPDSGLPPLPGEVIYRPVGQAGNNLAITALAVRPGIDGAELFARVKNYGGLAAQAILSIYANDRIVQSQQIELNGSQDQSIILSDLPPEAVRYEARLQPVSSQPDSFMDDLSLDNQAFTIFQTARQGRALLVSTGNLFLEQMLSSLEGIQAYRVLPDEDGSLVMPQESFDLYVLDGVLPDPIPEGNILWINPPSSDLLPSTGVFTDTSPAIVHASPLTEYVDWSNVHVLQARRIQPPEWAQTLIQAPGGPLVLSGEYQGHRLAAISFDLHDSDLPLQLAFPVLMANLINDLQVGDVYHLADLPAIQPGQRLSLPATASSGTLQVTDPSGQVSRIEADRDSQFLLQFDQIGFYRLADPNQPNREALIAVNLFSPEESELTPASRISIGQTSIPANQQTDSGQRELWPWLAGAALLTLWLEWWVYHQRQFASGDWKGRLSRALLVLGGKRKPGGSHE